MKIEAVTKALIRLAVTTAMRCPSNQTGQQTTAWVRQPMFHRGKEVTLQQ
jgi:hypothetical protein